MKWKEQNQGNALPTMDELLEFLHSRRTHSERFEKPGNLTSNNGPQSRLAQREIKSNRLLLNYSAQTSQPYCHLCKDGHYTQNCEKLLRASANERNEIVKNAKLCFNCLRSNHLIISSTSNNCKKCNGRHHTLLHRETQNCKQSNQENRSIQTTQANVVSLMANDDTEVLLATAVVTVFDRSGDPHPCRVFIDSSEKTYQDLQIKYRNLWCIFLIVFSNAHSKTISRQRSRRVSTG